MYYLEKWVANTFLAISFKMFLDYIMSSEVHCHSSVYFHCTLCMIRKFNVWKCSRGGAALTRLLLSIASVMSIGTQLIELVLFSTRLWHVLIHPPHTLTRVNWIQCSHSRPSGECDACVLSCGKLMPLSLRIHCHHSWL